MNPNGDPVSTDPATDRIERALRDLVVETPSWGYGDSGTRFATFQQPGRPRDVFERVDDAAEVHRLTADLTGREVLAGPVEATAMGNVLVQCRAAGELGSLADIRAVVGASTAPVVHEPSGDRDAAQDTYNRFLDVTGLRARAAA